MYIIIIIINYSTCIHLSIVHDHVIANHQPQSKDSLILCLAGVIGVADLIEEGVIDTLCLVSVNSEAIMVQ